MVCGLLLWRSDFVVLPYDFPLFLAPVTYNVVLLTYDFPLFLAPVTYNVPMLFDCVVDCNVPSRLDCKQNVLGLVEIAGFYYQFVRVEMGRNPDLGPTGKLLCVF